MKNNGPVYCLYALISLIEQALLIISTNFLPVSDFQLFLGEQNVSEPFSSSHCNHRLPLPIPNSASLNSE